MARKKIIAGNWKMNMTPSEAVELVNTLKPLAENKFIKSKKSPAETNFSSPRAFLIFSNSFISN